jgi:hypothetical protein
MRRLIRIAALLCIAASVLVGLLPSTSSAEAPQATGWWSRRVPFQGDAQVEGQSARQPVRFRSASTPQQELPVPVPGGEDGSEPTPGPVTTLPSPAPVPTVPPVVTLPDDEGPGTPNPTVPEGGLWVANDATGPAAISALRYRGDIGSAELTLAFAPGSSTVGPVVACPALSEFDPGPEGAWGDRPAHDCQRFAISGRTTTDGSAMAFSIPQGFVPFGKRTLDIVVLPAPGSGDTFSLYFQKPGEDSLDVISGQELPPPVAELPEPDPLTLPTTLPETTPSFDAGSTSDFTDLPVVTEDVPAPAEIDLTGDDGSVVPTQIAELFEPFTESRTGRIIAVGLLLAMGAGLWYFGGQPVRHPQLLGALAGDGPVADKPSPTGRGIGRFQRERTAPPNRL